MYNREKNMANYMHPSISSTITDNSVTYVTASGTTKLFAAFTSAKGEDNRIKMITSVSEYEFNYGEPNIKKYGQVGYNVVNWLNSGGVVYCLRVLPEDAGYANAIVNIQTKVSSKKALDVNGNPVTVRNVTLRPTVSYTSVNNITESSIEFDELRKPITDTIDGYQNNMLFAVIPKGRGEGYNDLGFRISLLDQYDATYEFRLYSFEVTQVSESGSTSTIEGPFTVALDPDALSLSGESIFIENVINKYCKFLKVVFNEDNYERLGEIINPNVHPNRIDFFNGQTRVINGETETYYDEVTGKDEDIHFSLIKYGMNNLPTGERNIVDPTSSIEGAIVGTDNNYRKSIYDRYENALNRMKVALSKVKKANASSNPLATMLNVSISDIQNDTNITDTYTSLNQYVSALSNNVSNDNYNEVKTCVNNLVNLVDKRLNDLYELYDYSRIDGDSANSIAVSTELSNIESTLYVLDNYSIKYSNMIQQVNGLVADVSEAILNNNNIEKEELAATVISTCSDIVSIINTSNSTNQHFADSAIADAVRWLSSISDIYTDLTSTYITDEEYVDNLALIYGGTLSDPLDNRTVNQVNNLFDSIKFAINLTLLEVEVESMNSIQSDVSNATTTTVNLIDSVIAKVGSLTYDVNDIVTNLSLFESQVKSKKQITYKTILQNFDSNVNLLFGSDGAITGCLPSDPEVEKLIVKGYKGTIDSTLLDKNLLPIDMVLDANYSTSVKNALVSLATDIRGDFVAILDTKTQATPEQALTYRRSNLTVNNFKVAIFAQDFIVEDTEYTGQHMQVTSPYFLASKIPTNDNNFGIHWNFVGPRRGTISGFESISYLPNPEWKEQLYKAQINYVEQDLTSTRFGCQLTSQSVVSALSNINNVRALLRIQREVEQLMAAYQHEYNDTTTRSAAQAALNNYLATWVSNRACDSIKGTVYASDYDRLEKLLRVKVEMVFNSVIERIAIDLIVNN